MTHKAEAAPDAKQKVIYALLIREGYRSAEELAGYWNQPISTVYNALRTFVDEYNIVDCDRGRPNRYDIPVSLKVEAAAYGKFGPEAFEMRLKSSAREAITARTGEQAIALVNEVASVEEMREILAARATDRSDGEIDF
ncbi:hypothetical protein [Halogranum rubrum]|uniref:hypothetical protein n=1 Tax=Halogranum rubrum TaxID=553466 RepID=UPI0006776194|nr:hypothetical protein [Halogranum salarium]